jgi:ABC-type transporter Mla MlaB component
MSRKTPASVGDIGSYADEVYTLPAKVTHAQAPALAAALLQAVEFPRDKRGTKLAYSPEQLQRQAQGESLADEMPAVHLSTRRAASMVLDASALREFDSSLLVALMQMQRKTGGRDEIHHAPAQLLELIKVYGLEEAMPAIHLRVGDAEKFASAGA